ncbi:MAG: UDP-3-O-(3-hydroxymyristoyl)glucosamine N-acyltransferase, partial [Muribaculaceae bacterium]|nr:UDP-3-O-(3-hydroxymyristoyl)glucosamine N-acyltransferase [Muribaculaceae bacterium]
MKITPNLLASLTGGCVEGDGNIEISGFGKIEEAGPGCVTFIANPKYSHFIHTTKASAVLVNEDFQVEGEIKPVLIRVKDAYSALAELLTAFESVKPRPVGIEQPCYISEGIEIPEDAYIGAFSYLGTGVKIGKGVLIYPQSYIGNGVVIGAGSIIRSGVKIYEGCSIGERCIIHSGAVIGADGFGFAPKGDIYEKIPQIGNVIIEDDVEVGANTCIDRATFGHTVIGKGTKLDNLLQVAHNVEIGRNNVFAAQTGIAGSTKIGDSNRVGGQCGFAGHIVVGNNNEFGAQSGIPNSIGSDRRLIGYPAIDARQFAKNQVFIRRLEEL